MGRLHLAANPGSPHCPRSPQSPAGSARRTFSSSAQRPSRHSASCCEAVARQPDGGAGGADDGPDDSIDTAWRQRRIGALWASLSEQDRTWAVRNFAAEAINGSEGGGSSSNTSTMDEGWDLTESVLATLWPAAMPATYSPAPGQQARLNSLTVVYVILFGAGTSDTEGIYSLRVMSREDGLPQNTIVAFSAKEDAERYAGLLEATMDHMPSVCPIEPKDLLDFCEDSGYSYRVETEGSLLIPPDYYVGITDWERCLRLREGRWSVQERDWSSLPLGNPDSSPQGTGGNQPPTESATEPDAELPSQSSSYVLEEQRARLERLAAQE